MQPIQTFARYAGPPLSAEVHWAHLHQRSHILETETFKDTFGPKAQRKKPRLDVGTFEELGKASFEALEEVESSTVQGADGDAGVSGINSCMK